MSSTESAGYHRVAAFLLSLDREAAARVLKTIDPAVVPDVARAMVELDPKLGSANALNGLWSNVGKAINSPKTVSACGEDTLRDLIARSHGAKRADEILAELKAQRMLEHPFHAVEKFAPGLIFRSLKDESSAAKALVLANIDPAVAGEILCWLEEEDALDVVSRIATLEAPPSSTLQSVAFSLEESLTQLREAAPVPDPTQRLQSVANLLSYAPPELEQGVLKAMGEENSEMANELRELMITWEDIGTIDKRSMQKILGTVDTKTLSIALKASSVEVEENILGNLSERVRSMVADERDLAGALPIGEVIGAREEIMKNIRAMIEAGEFSPSRKGEELVS
ncbi:MAG: flagellar motor switch protein FliG [Planctomycetota bacterium]|jgi:flagellar motor switch protein FliG